MRITTAIVAENDRIESRNVELLLTVEDHQATSIILPPADADADADLLRLSSVNSLASVRHSYAQITYLASPSIRSVVNAMDELQIGSIDEWKHRGGGVSNDGAF